MAKPEKNEEERGEKRKREEEKEENETGTVLVKEEIWRVVVIFLGKTPWRRLRTGLIVNLIRVRVCVWCLM